MPLPRRPDGTEAAPPTMPPDLAPAARDDPDRPGRGSPPTSWLSRQLAARPGDAAAVATAAGCAVLVALIATVDHLTGFEVAFSVFYLAPVSAAAWYLGRAAGTLTATVSAATWVLVDLSAGHVYSHAAIPWWNGGVRLAFFLVVVWLLVTLRRQLELARQLARTDQLTGVLNGRAFQDEGDRALALARRLGQATAVLFVDADGFKQVNDRLGHSAGDRVLETIGRTLHASVRGTDLVARLGGDEFALLLGGVDTVSVPDVAGKVREALLAAMAEGGWPVTFSIGAATFATAPGSLDEAIAEADALMYAANRSGKDRVAHRLVA